MDSNGLLASSPVREQRQQQQRQVEEEEDPHGTDMRLPLTPPFFWIPAPSLRHTSPDTLHPKPHLRKPGSREGSPSTPPLSACSSRRPSPAAAAPAEEEDREAQCEPGRNRRRCRRSCSRLLARRSARGQPGREKRRRPLRPGDDLSLPPLLLRDSPSRCRCCFAPPTVLGLFADSHMKFEIDRAREAREEAGSDDGASGGGLREPSLAEMTRKALQSVSPSLRLFVSLPVSLSISLSLCLSLCVSMCVRACICRHTTHTI